MIPINDLSRHVEPADTWQQELDKVRDVLERGLFFGGPATERFEHDFAAYVGVEHCAGVASGTDALTLALEGVGVGPGAKVATVANAGFYTSVACRRIGAQPVYVDVDPRTACIDADQLRGILDGSFAAVVATHLYGQVADVEALSGVCDRWGVPLIEDCAQATGGRVDGNVAGSFGTVGCFSFYPTKNLGAFGDAGAVVSDSADVVDRIRAMAQYGWSQKYRVTHPGGMNARLDEVQAAVLAARLPRLDALNAVRRQIAARVKDVAHRHGCRMFFEDGDFHVAHLAVLQVCERDAVRQRLGQLGVGTEVHYPIPDHRQPVVMQAAGAELSLPVTEMLAESVVTVPCFPALHTLEIDHLLDSLDRVLVDQGSWVAP